MERFAKKIKNKLIFFFRYFLCKIFKFDKWHITPISSRPYALDLIKFLNGLENKNNYLEIGCGLGDIIRNVKYKSLIGLDQECEVLKAAKFICSLTFKGNILFKTFHFPGDPFQEKFNAIVLVNWIHNIEPFIIREKVAEYFHKNLLDGGLIIIDSVNYKGYKYYHNIQEVIRGLDCSIEKIGSYDCNRELWAIKKT